MASTPDNTTIKVDKTSWLRKSDLLKLDDSEDQKIFYDLYEAPSIVGTAADTEYSVIKGDRIDRLSQRFYGTPYLWWVIAERNDIELPSVELWPGRVLIIPNPQTVQQVVLR